MAVSILGIRHHGCGSARSVKQALTEINPDIILIEGAPEANEIIHLAAHSDAKPPVAILIYAPDEPKKAVYYPFAEFSPEWQAMIYGLQRDVSVRFIDLPQSNQLAIIKENEAQTQENPDVKSLAEKEFDEDSEQREIRKDPLRFAANVAGFDDGEIWWENLIENRNNSVEIFAGILELMTALREEAANDAEITDDVRLDEKREAFMRQEIRRAQRENFQNIVVVCGAWHAPELIEIKLKEFAKTDTAKLKNLPKIRLNATWIPYTYNRLSFSSGYGAGVTSPEFYHQIWKKPDNITIFWLSRVAQLLREQDLEASSASVIEAVQLAENLATMRQLAAVGLNEMNDAIRAVFCFGDDAPLKLIHEKLIVGTRIGQIPSETPQVPLQRDLAQTRKRLRFPSEAFQKTVELDLRKDNDLGRSQLLHRLNLLNIYWGIAERAFGKGTFKEAWRLQWSPEFEISVIEANVWGNTVFDAATNFVKNAAQKSDNLAELTSLVENVLLADLPNAVDFLMAQIQIRAAVSSDVSQMMDALPPLANVVRYGNVRKTDTKAVEQVVNGLITRVCIGLSNACAALNDDSANKMFQQIIKTNNAVMLLQKDDLTSQWHECLRKLVDLENVHGLITGRSVRVLFDAQRLTIDDVDTRLNLALSTANEPANAAAWLEGFLRESGLVLLHNDILLKILDDWVESLSDEHFLQIVPLLRRTFTTFHAPERRKIGERIKNGTTKIQIKSNLDSDGFDFGRAKLVLPIMAQLLGLKFEVNQ